MLEPQKPIERVNRRAALRAAVPLAAGGAGLALASRSAAGVSAQASAWTSMHLEVDATPVNAVSVEAAGSGPPQRGDHFYVDAPIFAKGDAGGTQIGTYQCFGAWTRAGTDASGADQRLTTVQFNLDGQGAIMGLINEAGANPSEHIGAVQGGTGAFLGALGSFQQMILQSTTPPPGQPNAVVFRGIFDLLLPNVSTGG